MSAISIRNLTKRYGQVLAVDRLSFDVREGRVTGFLGPNGSGKTTTMRILLGLASPTVGTAMIGGTNYRELPDPARTVGACLDGDAFHPGRSAAQHLRVLATATGLPFGRVDDVLDLVGLSDVAGRRVGGFSLGMRQRLALGGALLGDPGVLVLDEPLNGLDPEGIRWVRALLRSLAADGRTVLLSSHLLGEVAQTADDVVVIARGRLVEETTLADFVDRTSVVRARTTDAHRLADALLAAGITVSVVDAQTVQARGVAQEVVGVAAAKAGLTIIELSSRHDDLETHFIELVSTTKEEAAA